MTKKTIITGFLALIFFYSGHLFITAYTQFHINQKKLGVLRGQERSIKYQQREFVQKKLTLDKVQAFMNRTSQLGLQQDQWDKFYVDLKEEGISFSKLETILAQTASSSQYFFNPISLEIRTGSQKAKAQFITSENTDTDSSSNADPVTQAIQIPKELAGSQSTNSADLESSDAVISMEGHFLINRRGLND